MTHTYSVTGMHCESCVEKVRHTLAELPSIKNVQVALDPPEAVIEMKEHIPVDAFNNALSGTRYSLQENIHQHQPEFAQTSIPETTLKTYYPLILIFLYLIGLVAVRQAVNRFSLPTMMSDFMGGFFLTFSFFKFLDLKGFAESYSSYDIITKRWLGFGYIYPFIELFFGIGFLFFPLLIALYIATLIVMSVSIMGVAESVFNKRKIKCACLGTVFNLPMGTITIIEDALMIVMSGAMLIMKLG